MDVQRVYCLQRFANLFGLTARCQHPFGPDWLGRVIVVWFRAQLWLNSQNTANVHMRCINLAQEVITSCFLPVSGMNSLTLNHVSLCNTDVIGWHIKICTLCHGLYRSLKKIININTKGGVWADWDLRIQRCLRWHTVYYQSGQTSLNIIFFTFWTCSWMKFVSQNKCK